MVSIFERTLTYREVSITVPTSELLFILFGFSCFAHGELKQFNLFGHIQTSQTGGQPYCETSAYGECSLYPCTVPWGYPCTLSYVCKLMWISWDLFTELEPYDLNWWWSQIQCDQIGQFFQAFGDKFWPKSSPTKYFVTFTAVLKNMYLKVNMVWILFGNFANNWATLYSTTWSHWSQYRGTIFYSSSFENWFLSIFQFRRSTPVWPDLAIFLTFW